MAVLSYSLEQNKGVFNKILLQDNKAPNGDLAVSPNKEANDKKIRHQKNSAGQ